MKTTYEARAAELLEKANADLEPDLISIPEAKARMKDFIHAQRLAAFGIASLARKIDDAESLARAPAPPWARPEKPWQRARS